MSPDQEARLTMFALVALYFFLVFDALKTVVVADRVVAYMLMAIVAVVERRRIRYAHMVGVTPRIMREGMRADYRLVDRLSRQLCDRMTGARTLRVQTAAGTDFSATFDPSLAWVKTSGLIDTRYWSNLPAGEVAPPLGVLADAARVEENRVRLARGVRQLVAILAERGHHKLAIEHVHLAADGFDVELFHSLW